MNVPEKILAPPNSVDRREIETMKLLIKVFIDHDKCKTILSQIWDAESGNILAQNKIIDLIYEVVSLAIIDATNPSRLQINALKLAFNLSGRLAAANVTAGFLLHGLFLIVKGDDGLDYMTKAANAGDKTAKAFVNSRENPSNVLYDAIRTLSNHGVLPSV
jgi:hypothetical protein